MYSSCWVWLFSIAKISVGVMIRIVNIVNVIRGIDLVRGVFIFIL